MELEDDDEDDLEEGDFLEEREEEDLDRCCWPRMRWACSLRMRSFSVCDSDLDLEERCAFLLHKLRWRVQNRIGERQYYDVVA